MGASGCGKTIVGRLLADRLAIKFYDGDSFYSPNNIIKMKRDIPLDDEERVPWLSEQALNIARWNMAE